LKVKIYAVYFAFTEIDQ